jgi:tetratricopeptide (TPR) repeat protein
VVAGGIVPGEENPEGNAQAFGRKFRVGTALLGRLLQRRTKLRLQVDLVDTKTGQELWADQYDRDFAELFLVEDDIIGEVSKQLRMNIGAEDAELGKRYSENPEAYQLYLRGRHWCESRTAEGFEKGVEYFKNAIQADPRYALAYAQLAVALYTPGFYGHCRPQDNFPAARAFATKALELDDGLAEAHEALASLNTFDWRWTEAEEEFRRSLEINPNHALSHFHYSMCLAELGRYGEAVSEATEAQVRDPLSGLLNAGLAWTLWAAREYDKSVEQSRTATELDPNSLFSRIAAGVSYEQNEMYRESIAEFQEGINRHGGPMFLGFQGNAFALSGDKASAWENIRQMEELSKTTFVTPAYLALTYAGLEEKDLAIQSLQAAYENRDTFLIFARLLPQFDNLRSDSRFRDLLHRMNFPS